MHSVGKIIMIFEPGEKVLACVSWKNSRVKSHLSHTCCNTIESSVKDRPGLCFYLPPPPRFEGERKKRVNRAVNFLKTMKRDRKLNARQPEKKGEKQPGLITPFCGRKGSFERSSFFSAFFFRALLFISSKRMLFVADGRTPEWILFFFWPSAGFFCFRGKIEVWRATVLHGFFKARNIFSLKQRKNHHCCWFKK